MRLKPGKPRPSLRTNRGLITVTVLSLTLPAVVPAAAPPDGAKLFQQRCPTCHSVRQVSANVRKRLPADRRDFLQRFLRTHHVHDDDEREALVSYLTEQALK